MNLDEYLRAVPPRCLSGLRPVAVVPRFGAASWRLRCVCGCEEGAVLGHPLRDLKPDVDLPEWLVSPLTFRCKACGQQAELLDTAVHGEGSEFAQIEGAGLGCAAIRGEGAPVAALCPGCGGARVVAFMSLSYHDDRIDDFSGDPNFPLADFFEGLVLDCECSQCGRQWVLSEFDTK